MPARRRRAAGLAVAAFAAIIVVSAILSQFLDAGDEQGLVPKSWDSSKAAPFIANALVVAVVAPFVEELLYRGLGYGLLTQFISALPAILITGLVRARARPRPRPARAGLLRHYPRLAPLADR